MSVLNKITSLVLLGFVTRKSLLTAACLTSTQSYWTQPKMSSTSSSSYNSGDSSICYVTTPNEESAKKIAQDLVTSKRAACVNIIPNIQSVYEWEGQINEDSEYLLMIKTTTENVPDLTTWVRENHPYSVAEVISVKIENGNPPYLDWIAKSVKKPTNN